MTRVSMSSSALRQRDRPRCYSMCDKEGDHAEYAINEEARESNKG